MRLRTRALGIALLLAGALSAHPVRALPWDIQLYFCIDDLVMLPRHIERIPIPLGCEVIDCCPGCPGIGPDGLDWRVQVAGKALQSVAIEFEGLSGAAPMQLEGDAKPTKTGALVGRGGAILHHLRGDGDVVSVASLHLRFDEAALAQMRTRGLEASAAELDSIEIVIEQILGAVVVGEFRLRYALRPCKFATTNSCDTVVQQNNNGADSSVVLLDGNRAGVCSNDEQYRADASVDVGNVLAPAACRSEVAIFSQGDAMELRAPETTWTDACGDRVVATLKPLLAMPVNVWLARPNAGPTADAYLANANLLYDENKTGISFQVAQTKDLSSDFLARAKMNLGCFGAAGLPGNLRTANQLNVYFIDVPSTGEICSSDPNFIFVGMLSNPATLAHEFGHALSLFGDTTTGGHTNGLPGFSAANIMWAQDGGSVLRTLFSLGQAFRFNVDASSRLNANGVRSGPTRACPALVSSDACPPLALDWSRP